MLKVMTHLKKGTLNDCKEISKIFQLYRNIFPHIRKDYLERNLAKDNVIFHNDVVIVYNQYKKKTRLGTIHASAGDYILHQIVTKFRDGRATRVFKDFVNNLEERLFLSVRADNKKAIDFYERNGMIKVGDISWKNNTLPGYVFLYTHSKNNHERFIDL